MKFGMTMSKLKPAFPYLTENTYKQLINMKVKPIVLYSIQLMIGQPQAILNKGESLMMRINKTMTSNPEGLQSHAAICKAINMDEPRQDIVKSSFTLIHKMIQRKQLEQILNQINIPERSNGKVYVKGNL